MRAGLKLTTCALVLGLGLTATDTWAAPGEPSPSAVKTTRRQSPPLVSAAGLKSHRLDKAKLFKERLQETTTGTKDPRTGQDLSKNANPGSGLPGGNDLGKEFPSAEKQWNERMKGALGGGLSDLSDGTPFDDKPGSDPADDFLKQHGGNIPDPFAGFGSGRSGFSPANDGPDDGSNSVGQSPSDQKGTADHSGGSTGTGEGAGFGGTVIYCGSDYAGKENLGKKGDDCVAIEYDREGNYKTEEDEKMHQEFSINWMPTAEDWNEGQQYEGEGGYTGGGGRGANNLNFGSARRMAGKVVGSRDPGAAGLGQDTGRKMPERFEAIEKFVARGGKVRGKAGYQGGDSGLGQDVGGAAGKRISGLKKAHDAQRFVVDPNAVNPDQIPWWLQEKVSPLNQASTAQANGAQAGLAKGFAAHRKNTAKTK